jgi:glycogen operon protein
MPAIDWAARDGSPAPLGASWIGNAMNFALYSRHAGGVTLLLFADDAATPVRTLPLDPMANKSGRVWHARIGEPDLAGARHYAYQVSGPADPGNRFDPAKVLLDPYAPGIWFPPAFDRQAARRPGSNAGRAPLGVLPTRTSSFDWGDDAPPRHGSDAVIYELHVRGFTRRESSGVAAEHRGTFAGVVEKIPYLQELGVTVVELLPVFQYDPQEANYWGYMPIHFFAPHDRYAGAAARAAGADGVRDEFRAMVRALHAAGIEVVLDVVYNHTGEGGSDGPDYSFRGIDNGTYYLLQPDLRTYRNDAGTGNVLRCAHPAVRKLVADSLRHWAREMHVDGFRFDLASIFSRRDDGTIDTDDPAIVAEISDDALLARVRLIAEPWDAGSYELGRSFPGRSWLQWNGRFRDEVRGFVKSDAGLVSALATRLCGSDDLFPPGMPDSYRPYQSVNFVTAHDGFCLYDLVSYARKHNEANGEQGRDGSDENLSWNCGWEGDDGAPPEVLALRRRQVRNFCTLLMLSNGTPMFCAGDEFLNTQGGNNNPFNRDDETTWLDWTLLQRNADVHRFFARMIAFRKAHPSLARGRAWGDDLRWYGVARDPDWSPASRSLAMCVHGGSVGDDDVYAMINAYWEPLSFDIQEWGGGGWRRVVDTALPSPQDIVDAGGEAALASPTYQVQPRSVVVLVRGTH